MNENDIHTNSMREEVVLIFSNNYDKCDKSNGYESSNKKF